MMELHASVAVVVPFTKAKENKIEPKHSYFAQAVKQLKKIAGVSTR